MKNNIDKENKTFKLALDYVENTNSSVFLTGKAGTGKTTFLKHLIENTKKKMVVLAPTGIAALNAGGQTLHSFFRLPFGPLLLGDRRFLRPTVIKKLNLGDPEINIYNTLRYSSNTIKLLLEVETIVIDEVSMLRADVLDTIDQILRTFRKNLKAPFGGVQMLFIGDPYQLPPVITEEDREILSETYARAEFYDSLIFKHLKEKNELMCFELTKVYRQSDPKFITLLNKVRTNSIEQHDIDKLNKLYSEEEPFPDKDLIELTSHNYKAQATNTRKLNELKTKEFRYYATIEGNIKHETIPCETELILKEGAQVVFVRNDVSKRFVNGTVGIVTELSNNSIEVEVEGNTIDVDIEEWKNIKYTWSKEKSKIIAEVLGVFSQYPLRLAWSITIHKSQGLTLDYVYADLESCFTTGQAYVALSRCTSLETLRLKSYITRASIRVNSDAIQFMESLQNLNTAEENIKTAKADFAYLRAIKALKKGNLEKCLTYYMEGMSIDNRGSQEITLRYLKVFNHKLQKRKIKDGQANNEETVEYDDKFFIKSILNNNPLVPLDDDNQPMEFGKIMGLIDNYQKQNPDINIGEVIMEMKNGEPPKEIIKKYDIEPQLLNLIIVAAEQL